MSTPVRTGASMTCHLTAYSPAEGYRVMFNGDGGRLELELADARQGRLALVTGLAANRSFETGAPVLTEDLLDLD
jgi:hypothetical protein